MVAQTHCSPHRHRPARAEGQKVGREVPPPNPPTQKGIYHRRIAVPLSTKERGHCPCIAPHEPASMSCLAVALGPPPMPNVGIYNIHLHGIFRSGHFMLASGTFSRSASVTPPAHRCCLGLLCHVGNVRSSSVSDHLVGHLHRVSH